MTETTAGNGEPTTRTKEQAEADLELMRQLYEQDAFRRQLLAMMQIPKLELNMPPLVVPAEFEDSGFSADAPGIYVETSLMRRQFSAKIPTELHYGTLIV